MQVLAVVDFFMNDAEYRDFAEHFVVLTVPLPDGDYKGYYIAIDKLKIEEAQNRSLSEDTLVMLVSDTVVKKLDSLCRKTEYDVIPPLT